MYIYIYISFFHGLSEAYQDAAADHCGINSGLFQPVPPAKSGPMCAPYSVHSIEAHRAEKAVGTVRSSSSLHWPMAWRKPAAKPALKAGGYSFKIAVDQLPVQSKPIEVALGRSKETCHWHFGLCREYSAWQNVCEAADNVHISVVDWTASWPSSDRCWIDDRRNGAYPESKPNVEVVQETKEQVQPDGDATVVLPVHVGVAVISWP